MDGFAAKGAGLVVTVDCGAVSHGPIAHARALGLDVVVFDHHQAPEALPDAAAIVDPNREDDLSGLGYLCAAGVTFMGLVALNRALKERGFFASAKPPDLIASLDLVALATVADVVPLVGLNRAFVTRGLAIMKRRERPGLAALFDAAGADGPPRAYHLGYLIGPRINAGGRIGDAALGARLLTVRDELQAREIAMELDQLNRARQQIEKAALLEAEAEALASLGLEERGAAVIVAGEGWAPGVVGLVAARLKERFERPAFAFALGAIETTGSARSIPGVDIGRVVRAAVEAGLALKGGGHAMAAGVTLTRAKLGDWRAYHRGKARRSGGRGARGRLASHRRRAGGVGGDALAHSQHRGGGTVRVGQSGADVRARPPQACGCVSGRDRPRARSRRRRRRQEHRRDRVSRRRQAARTGALAIARLLRPPRRLAVDQSLRRSRKGGDEARGRREGGVKTSGPLALCSETQNDCIARYLCSLTASIGCIF